MSHYVKCCAYKLLIIFEKVNINVAYKMFLCYNFKSFIIID